MKPFLLSLPIFLVMGCSGPQTKTTTFEDVKYEDIAHDLQTRLITAEAGDTVAIPPGHYVFSRSLIMEGKDSVTIMGGGIDKTVLSFHNQTEGAEGLRVQNGKNIVIRDLTIRDAAGDNLKIQDVNGLQLLNIKSEWTGQPSETNGAYALYPVMCQNVLIDGCIATGASDAGIYVGQSNKVIVRNSEAFNNVAGIEIENTTFADVYENKASDNTGGILVFDLPGLSQAGGNIRVFDNDISNNNYTNFAPRGNIVASVPPGTGMMVLATKDVEVFGNRIKNNRTAGVSIISYEFVMAAAAMDQSATPDAQMAENEAAYKADSLYHPIPASVYIHDNTISDVYRLPSFENNIGYLLIWQFGLSVPDILWDGITGNNGEQIVCLQGNGTATFGNLDAANDFDNSSKDAEPFACKGKQLPAVKLDGHEEVAWNGR